MQKLETIIYSNSESNLLDVLRMVIEDKFQRLKVIITLIVPIK